MTASLPHARVSAPWSGHAYSNGRLYAHPAARGWTMLTYDPEGHDFAMSLADPPEETVEMFGRVWDVVWVEESRAVVRARLAASVEAGAANAGGDSNG